MMYRLNRTTEHVECIENKNRFLPIESFDENKF